MPDASVSSCVLNILGSFASSLALFKKVKEKRRKKRRSRRDDRVDDEELRLSRSLRQGPEDIGREYQSNIYATGDQFAIGDAIAQTSLAEILLRLNVGLVGIITTFVNGDKNDVQVDYQHLTDLSERCRVDTCRTLRQLYKRIMHFKQPLAITAPEHYESRRSAEKQTDVKKKKATNEYTKVRGPMIAKVIIQDSSRPPQIAMVKPAERRKKSSSSSSSGSNSSSVSKARSEPSLLLATPPPEYTPVERSRPEARRMNTAPDTPKPSRKGLHSARSTSHMGIYLPHMPEPLPSMPELDGFAVPIPPVIPRQRKPTPTYYSIASDSTRLGEIPLHKWNVPYDFDAMSVVNKQAMRDGWPANQVENQKKRFGLFRLFRRRRD